MGDGEYIKEATVARSRTGNVAIVDRVVDGTVEDAVDEEKAGGVNFVFDFGATANLDEDIDFSVLEVWLEEAEGAGNFLADRQVEGLRFFWGGGGGLSK